MIKNKRIHLRVSEATYIDILDRAIDKGMSISEYIRYTSTSTM
ncbi:MAG: plasmid mobilization protein [Methylophagaceae bacterium]|jgi:predicted DNA binding CopG/RHH family protein